MISETGTIPLCVNSGSMKRILSGLFLVISLLGFAQKSRIDLLIPVTNEPASPSAKSLEAKFSANITSGVAPLSVQFTDQSTGNPTSWKWNFGNGDSSLVQNPLYVYQSAGTFTVKLTISDGTNGFALEKKDFIKVNPDYVTCDTMRYPLPEPLTYYIITNKGYVTGNNSYGDKAICDYFDNMQSNLLITGVICEFSRAKQAAGNNEKIPVKVWKADVASGKPGIVLGSDTLLLSEIVNNVANNQITTIDFDDPVQPGASFYIGVQLPVITGDTLCLWSTNSGSFPVNTTWILESNDVWESAQAIWSPPGGPEFIISGAVYPKVCLLNGIDNSAKLLPYALWPNPAHDYITIVNQQGDTEFAQFIVYDISGKEMLKGKITDALCTSLNVGSLKPGIYFLKIQNEKSAFSSRFIIK